MSIVAVAWYGACLHTLAQARDLIVLCRHTAARLQMPITVQLSETQCAPHAKLYSFEQEHTSLKRFTQEDVLDVALHPGIVNSWQSVRWTLIRRLLSTFTH